MKRLVIPGRTKFVALEVAVALLLAATVGGSAFGEWGSVYLGALLAVMIVVANLMYDIAAAPERTTFVSRRADEFDL
jgi:hypothetical protein